MLGEQHVLPAIRPGGAGGASLQHRRRQRAEASDDLLLPVDTAHPHVPSQHGLRSLPCVEVPQQTIRLV